jgi:predicted secreted hydrolase
MHRRLCLHAMALAGLPAAWAPAAAQAAEKAAGAASVATSEGHPMATPAGARPATPPPVAPGRHLAFPRDFGAHPDARTEWWYLTGWLAAPPANASPTSTTSTTSPVATTPPAWGFQLTFFRSRTDIGTDSRSAFAPRQLVLAHAALTDVQHGRLWHAQQLARAGFGVVHAAEADTDVRLRDWSLQRRGTPETSVYTGQVQTPDFRLRLRARSTQPLLLQGQQGYSRKGPMPAQASHYYSQPQLAVSADLDTPLGMRLQLQGKAWLDHEWSESVLDARAVGWDWIGMNLDDGSSLMAFRIRDRQGQAMWAGGSWRSAAGQVQVLAPDGLHWTPLRHWQSPHTGARYPVAWQLEVAGRRLQVQALVPDQEQDARASTGTAYWEGLSALRDAQGAHLGWGYLEMTGYAGKLSL